MYKGGGNKIFCKGLGSSKAGASNTNDVPLGLPSEVYAHTHPNNKTERADDPGDREAAETKLKMDTYVLSRGGVHKYARDARGRWRETTEIKDRDYYKKHGKHWYDFTDADSCGCS